MANALYAKARQAFLDGALSWTANDIKVALVDTGLYTVDLAAHQYLSDIPAAARVAASSNLTGKTSTDGVADADNVTIGPIAASVELVVLYQDSGVEASSRLIAAMDTGINLPALPTGGAITVFWDDGPNRIFKL